MKRHLPIISLLLFILCVFSAPKIALSEQSYHGWSYLTKRLRQDGFSELYIKKIFSDPRMPYYKQIPFSAAPKEREEMYADFTSSKNIERGVRCIMGDLAAFRRAEQEFAVPRNLIAAILLVETKCGDYTGNELIINRLARMASLNEPKNIKWNYQRLKDTDSSITFDKLKKRADYLDAMFYPEVKALLKLSKEEGLDVFTLRGSYAGAFGLPQFLPSTYLKYAIDGDNNGVKDLMTLADAVLSIANFLASEGWDSKAALGANREVIWKYNHSIPYVDTILRVAFLIGTRLT